MKRIVQEQRPPALVQKGSLNCMIKGYNQYNPGGEMVFTTVAEMRPED
jgi:hypothetical protein